MPTKPTVAQLDWVPSNSGVRVEPTGSKKNQGWSPLEPLPAQNENWILYSIDQWIKYLERVTDSLFANTFTVGTAAQVTAGEADFDDPQDAYDAAKDNGGGIVKIMSGNIVGDLAIDGTAGIIIEGAGWDSVLTGNVTMTGTRNVLKDFRITGTFAISGSASMNAIQCWVENTFTNSADNLLNWYSINNVKAMVQTITFGGAANPNVGNYTITHKGSTTGNLDWTSNAAAVQAALRLLPDLGFVTVTGTFGAGFTVTFLGVTAQPGLLSVTNTMSETVWRQDYMGIYGSPFDPPFPCIQATSGTYRVGISTDQIGGGSNAYSTVIQWNANAAAVQTAIRTMDASINQSLVTLPDAPALWPYLITWVGLTDASPFIFGDSSSLNSSAGMVTPQFKNLQEYGNAPSTSTVALVNDSGGMICSHGGGALNKVASATYNLTAKDNGSILLVVANQPMQFNLPAPMKGFEVDIYDGLGNMGINWATLNRNGTEKIEFLAENYVMDANGIKKKLTSDGIDWFLK